MLAQRSLESTRWSAGRARSSTAGASTRPCSKVPATRRSGKQNALCSVVPMSRSMAQASPIGRETEHADKDSAMDCTQYLEHWDSRGPDLVGVRAPLTLSRAGRAGAVPLAALKRHVRWRWVVAGLHLVASWAGLGLLWSTLAAQIVALREAITGFTGAGTLLMRALPVWGEGTLLGPTIAGLVQLFRPPSLVRRPPTRPARSEQPTETPLRGVQRWRTQPSPAIMPDPPPDAPAEPSA